MKEATHHVLLWGWLRLVLAIAQLTCVPLALVAWARLGVAHWLTLALAFGATAATTLSVVLYRGRRDPRLPENAQRKRGT